MATKRPSASALWNWTIPLRRLKQQRRRFASSCFLAAGIAFGTTLYLLATRVDRLADPRFLTLLFVLVGLLVALFFLGVSAESDVEKIDAEIAELEAEATRILGMRG